jgi:hypothetical protein
MSVWKQYTPTDKLILAGNQETGEELNVQTATGMIPGVLVIGGTTDDDIIVGTAALGPVGVLGYEKTTMLYRPKDSGGAYFTMDGTYAATTATAPSRAFVHQATDLAWYGWLIGGDASGATTGHPTVLKGEVLYPAANGMLSLTPGSGSGARAYAWALESKASSASAQRLKVQRL